MSIPGSASPLFFTAAADAAAAGPIKSVRFNDGDSAYLNRTPSSAGNRTTWTWTGWVKRGNSTNYPSLYSVNGEDFVLRFTNTDTLEIYSYGTGYNFRLLTTAVYRDFSAWYHVLLAYDSTQATDSDRISLYVNGSEVTSFSSTTWPSLNYQSGNSATAWHIGNLYNIYYFDGYLADVYFIDGQALDPTSFGAFDDNGVWQAAAYSGTFGTNGFHLFDFANESGIGDDSSGNNNDFTVNNITLSAVNYANAVATATNGEVPNSGTPYIVDVQPTNANLSYGSSPGIEEVFNGVYNSGYVYWVGTQYSSGNVTRARFDLRDFSSISTLRIYGGFSGYTAYNYQLLDSSKSAISGTSGSFGAIGWHSLTISGSPRYLEISCTSGSNRRLRLYAIEVNGTVLTNDSPSNLDILFDVPTNGTQSDTGAGGEVSGNYCTWNPLVITTNNSLANGNLEASHAASTGWSGNTGGTGYAMHVGNMGVTSGKYYWEGEFTSSSTGAVGVVNKPQGHLYYVGYADTNAKSAGFSTTYVYNNGFGSAVGSLPAISQGDIIGVAIDMDNGKLYFSVNGTYVNSGDPVAGTGNVASGLNGETIFPAVSHLASANAITFVANFGQRAFAYSAPSGYKALCTTNLPTATVPDGSDYFDTKLYTGNGSTQSITGLEFSPDFLWFKNRSDGSAAAHRLFDTVRGANKTLFSNFTTEELEVANSLTSFDSNGFTVGSGNWVNGSSDGIVAWAWNAGANSSKTYTVKVVSDSGNKYRFDDFGTSAVTLDLEEGSTYVFDQSDSSNSGHPLRFSTTSDGTHGSGTEYTTGVTTTGTPGSAGAKTTIVVGSGVATLYYYCSAHSGMGGQANTNSTAGASNFDGTIQSTVRASQEAGFSIIKYTGNGSANQSIGHHLNSKPSLIIIKSRDNARNWVVIPTFINDGHFFYLNDSSDLLTNLTSYYGTHTSSVVGITGSNSGTNSNASGEDYLCYAFAPVAGYSAFGTYVGLGGAGEPFVHTGFAVKFLMIKRTDSSGEWAINDAVRNTFNPASNALFPDRTSAEDATRHVDLLSNGFKLKNSSPIYNSSGGSYVYMALASNPFQANGGLAR